MSGQITIGTLITQDGFVGVFFALAPLFRPSGPAESKDSAEAAEQKVGAGYLVSP